MNACCRGVLVVLLFGMPVVEASAAQRDCDGDGHDDIAWRNSTSGADVLWRWGKPGKAVAFTTVRDLHWKIVGEGDFDGDGHADLLWRNGADGRNVIWRDANSTTPLAVAQVPDIRFEVAGAGDFDGDGRDDILWKHPTKGFFVWPAAKAWASFEVGGLQLTAIADMDRDGRDDLVTCGPFVFGITGCYLLPGADWRGQHMFTSEVFDLPHSQVQAVGDFDGDGAVDLFWRNTTTGENVLWPDGNADRKRTLLRVPDLAWNVVAAGDYDGDGKTDLFWRHRVRGYAVVWPAANGANYRLLAQVATSWSVVP